MSGFSGEVAVRLRGTRITAWGAVLVSPSGAACFRASGRAGSAGEAAGRALSALAAAASQHRAGRPFVAASGPGFPPGPGAPARGAALAAGALAESLLPPKPFFPKEGLERVGPLGAVDADYRLDLVAKTCSCPSFRYRRVLCKHLRAALGIGAMGGGGTA